MNFFLIGNTKDTEKFYSIINNNLKIKCLQIEFTDELTDKHYNDKNQVFIIIVQDKMYHLASNILINIKKHNPLAHIILICENKDFELMSTALEFGVNHFWIHTLLQERLIDKLLLQIKNLIQEKTTKKILAIGAHPDDIEIGCGGTLLKHRSKKEEVFILTLSRGSQGGNTDKRFLEAKAAANYLDAHLNINNLKDTLITDGPKTIRIIEETIYKVQPDIIYTHSIRDNHQDHRYTNLATIVAARKIDQIYAYQAPSATVDFYPQKFESIDDYINEKLKLIALHKTQKEKCIYLNDDIIKANAIYWGRFAKYRLVEPFEIIRS